MKRRRVLVRAGVVIAVAGVVWVAAASTLVMVGTRGRTYSDGATIPARRVGLVLGCSRILPNGWPNAFFENRVQAAAGLFRAGKIAVLVVSGDHHAAGYDEPQDMKNRLVELGVPEDRIYCDYAGFRTLDSIVRVREIFGQTEVTIISQKFHNQRAIYIARHRGIDAIGFNAPEVEAYGSFLTKCRELGARANMLLDLFVFRRAPRFLGQKIVLPEA